MAFVTGSSSKKSPLSSGSKKSRYAVLLSRLIQALDIMLCVATNAASRSLTKRRLSGVDGISSIDNWLDEPPSIVQKIALGLPGCGAISYSASAGLGNLDSTTWPNWKQTPNQRCDSLSIDLQYTR